LVHPHPLLSRRSSPAPLPLRAVAVDLATVVAATMSLMWPVSADSTCSRGTGVGSTTARMARRYGYELG
jgi:hypothetical protein